MRNLYKVNGVYVELEGADLDGDGVTGGVETLRQSNKQIDVKETTELKDVMDTVFPKRLDQKINMLGNIDKFEASSLFKLRSLVNAKFLPQFCLNVVDEYLELSISINARGRDDGRDISIGKMERDRDSMKQKLNNFSGMGVSK